MRHALWVLALAAPALADEPLPSPEKHEVWSPNKKFVAVLDPGKNETAVFSVAKEKRTPLWSMTGWHRMAWLSNDGEALVTEYPGLNLLNRNYAPSDALITFWVKGKQLGAVKVDDVFPGGKGLKKTVSHWAWGTAYADGETVTLSTEDGRTLRYDLKSGAAR